MHSITPTHCSARFVTDYEIKAYSTGKFLPLPRASKLISINKSDWDEEMVMAPTLPEQWIGNFLLLTIYLSEQLLVYPFCYMPAFLEFRVHNVRHDNSSVHVQGLDGPCQCSRVQTTLTDDQWTWYRAAGYCEARKLNLNLLQYYLTKSKWVISYEWLMGCSKHHTNWDELQLSCCIQSFSKLDHSLHRPGAHCRDFENCLW